MEKRILIVDDSAANVEILSDLLCDEYELATAACGEECMRKLHTFAPDLVLLDIVMPGENGYIICRRIKSTPVGQFTQVILVSSRASTPERLQGYEAGADDYVTKPFDHDELLAKVRVQFRLRDTLADLWSANAKIREFNTELENLVERRAREVLATRDVAVFALAKLAESRDPETGEHLDRIRNYSRVLAEQLGGEGPYADQIDAQFLEDIYRSSPLHDIGKVGIPDAILLKPARLTPEEFEVMRRHSGIGADSLQQAVEQSSCGSFLDMAIDIARHHHERFDGAGYPDGLSGREIPLAARIVALADVYDALTSPRVYKDAYEPALARKVIEGESGEHFDPVVVKAFQARYDDFLAIVESADFAQRELAGASADVPR